MQRYLIACTLALVILLTTSSLNAQEQSELPSIYRIVAEQCQHDPIARTLTGFQLRGTSGIITALHGVVDCDKIEAKAHHPSDNISGLIIDQVDIRHDIAVLNPLSGKRLPNNIGLSLGHILTETDPISVSVRGHPFGMTAQLFSDNLHLRKNKPLISLLAILSGEVFELLNARKSPDPMINVLNIEGDLLPGHSGAPIFNNKGEVIGVGNGGLYRSSVAWAIPWAEIALTSAKVNNLEKLKSFNPGTLFEFPEKVSSPLPEGWLKLKIAFRASLTSEQTITQVVSTQHQYQYALFLPQNIDLSQADIRVTQADSDEPIAAAARINTPFSSINQRFIFRIDDEVGHLMLTVKPVSSFSNQEPCVFTVFIYNSKDNSRIGGAKVTLAYNGDPYIGFTNQDGYYKFIFVCDVANEPIITLHVEAKTYMSRDKELRIADKTTGIYLIPLLDTSTPTLTPTATIAPTLATTFTPIPAPTSTNTPKATVTPTNIPIAIPTWTPTSSPTSTETPSSSPRPTDTPIPSTATATFTATPTNTSTAIPTDTSTLTATPRVTNILTPTPMNTPVAMPTDTPTATNTATNTPSPMATSTPTPLPNAVVTVSNLNVRNGPGIAYTRVGGVKRGDTLKVIGQAYNCGWLKVITPNESEGWVSGESSYVTHSLPCEQISAATIPPIPTFNPTPTPTRGSPAPTASSTLLSTPTLTPTSTSGGSGSNSNNGGAQKPNPTSAQPPEPTSARPPEPTSARPPEPTSAYSKEATRGELNGKEYTPEATSALPREPTSVPPKEPTSAPLGEPTSASP